MTTPWFDLKGVVHVDGLACLSLFSRISSLGVVPEMVVSRRHLHHGGYYFVLFAVVEGC